MAEPDKVRDAIEQLFKLAGGSEGGFAAGTIAARMLAALAAGILLAFAYRRTYTGVVYLNAVAHTQVLLAVGGALIWLVVGDNLVRAFGLAGMIGLIRYRTRIADPKDTTILLFSMIIGMACGLGQYVVAGLGVLFVALALVWLRLTHRPAHTLEQAAGLKALLDLNANEKGDDDD